MSSLNTKENSLHLKIESDGRVFPSSDSSQSIINCLENCLKRLNICVMNKHRVDYVVVVNDDFDNNKKSIKYYYYYYYYSLLEFQISIASSDSVKTTIESDVVILATGSSRFVIIN